MHHRIPLMIASAAAAVLAITVPATALASPANPAPVNLAGLNAHAPAFSPASPLANFCASGEQQSQFDNVPLGLVAQWNASDNYFITPTSGHTILCATNEKTINGIHYWEYRAVLNGSETSDCVSAHNGPSGVEIGLNGCLAGENYELWSAFSDSNPPPSGYTVVEKQDSCMYSDGTNDPFLQLGTSAGKPCFLNNFDSWGPFPG